MLRTILQDSNIFLEALLNQRAFPLNAPVKKELSLKKPHRAWLQKSKQQYMTELAEWERQLNLLESEHREAVKEWEFHRDRFDRLRQLYNSHAYAYWAGDPEAVKEFFELVLCFCNYRIIYPQLADVQYNHDNKMLILDYQLPPKACISKLAFAEVLSAGKRVLSEAAFTKIYDSVLYQITLRTIGDLFSCDKAEALDAIVFNGYVNSANPATGHDENICILSMQASKKEFLAVNLPKVDPKACFKSFKGVGCAKLSTITPVAPLVKLDKTDRRFVTPYDVANTIQEGDNLAMMDWEDFEHLIRELFEKDFTGAGSEVKVTRASRDGGIDAVVFDPDPIHGGKIVIQAKRYANTVGVSAVRDLYGAMINEGANKEILVTTAEYGSDAYEFAKAKPLVLLNGGNLLHLLEKHGHKARIDLREAKAALSAK